MLTTATDRRVFERYLTEAEERQLLGHIAKHAGLYARRDHAWIRLARQTGLRVGSLGGLTVADAQLALSEGQLRVRNAIAKGRRGYDVRLNDKATEALRDLLSVRRAMRLPLDAEAPLICSRLGRGLSERSFQHRMQLWRQSSGLAVAASPHWLRHTLARRVMDRSTARDPQAMVQVALGHRSRESTVVYTLPTREEIDRAMKEAQ